MNDKTFEVRGPRALALRLSDVTDQEAHDIVKEALGEPRFSMIHSSFESFQAHVAHYEARGAEYIVVEGHDYLTLGAEEFHDRYTAAPDSPREPIVVEVPAPSEGPSDRDLRVIALQQAVAISARGNVANTEVILTQAKLIETYLDTGRADGPTETGKQ